MTKIHYLKNGFDACGRAGEFPEISPDINKVTCNACLRTITGHNAGGRPKKLEGRNIVQFSLTDKALANLQKIPKGERSKIISDFLES